MRKNKGPYLEANASGIWEIRWTQDGRSRRKSTGCEDKGAATRALADFIEMRPDAQPGGPGRVTVQQCLDLYWREHVAVVVKDQTRVAIALRHLGEALGKEKAYRLNDGHSRRYHAKRQKAGVGDGTVRRELSALSSALRFAQRWGWLDRVPAVPLPTAPEPKDFWLSRKQVDLLLDWLEENQKDSRLHRFVVIALATGARRGAIEELRWGQVWGDAIRFDWQVTTQTKKRRAPVPVSDWLRGYLSRWRPLELGASEWVLGHPGSVRGAFDWMRVRVADETGDESFAKMTRHSLRHTAATLMLQSGATLWQVAGVLGDDPRTVAKTYGHHAQDHLRDAVNGLGGFGRASESNNDNSDFLE